MILGIVFSDVKLKDYYIWESQMALSVFRKQFQQTFMQWEKNIFFIYKIPCCFVVKSFAI